jgi:hypothetical protein
MQATGYRTHAVEIVRATTTGRKQHFVPVIGLFPHLY